MMQFLRDIEDGKNPRLILMAPPRHGKSAIVSERFPVFAMGHHPDWQVMSASYAAGIAEKFSRKARALVKEKNVMEIFPKLRIDSDRTAAEEWETTAGGIYKAIGVGGSATGAGANILSIDDPIKGREQAFSQTYRDKVFEWYESEAETRLMPEAGVVMTLTRWHEDDLAGRLLKRDPGEWKVVSFQAIAEQDEKFRKEGEALHPERYPVERLLKIKQHGRWVWPALFQQNPTATEGGLIKRHWFKYYDMLPNVKSYTWSWDTAIKPKQANDYSVGGLWAECDNGFYLVKVFRDKIEYPELKRQVSMLYNEQKASAVLIEDKASGQQLLQDFQRDGTMPVIAMMPKKNMASSKEERVHLCSPLFEAGKVFIPSNAPWVADYVEELVTFPNAAHDDQVDMTTQFLSRHLFEKQSGVLVL